jgi:hypothetical protein
MEIKVRYGGQALAIVMIVLVVAVVIGMSMLSRTLRDQQRTIQEQTSAEALELSDSVLDVLKGSSVPELYEVCSNPEYGDGLESPNGCTAKGESSVTQFFTDLGVSNSVLDGFDSCLVDNSDVEIGVRLSTFEDVYEIRPDSVRSFVLGDLSPTPASCTVDMQLEARGSDNAGFLVTRVYGRDYVDGVASEYKEYAFSDSTFYCFNEGSGCPDGSVLSGEWSSYDPDTILSVALNDVVSGYKLDEVRVRAVGGVVALQSELSDADCISDTELIMVTSAANCAGSFRAKSVQLPQQDWGLPLFDYVLYNGSGLLQPQ